MSALSEDRPPHAAGIDAKVASIARWSAVGAAALRSVWPSAEDAWITAAELQLARRGTRHAAPIVAVTAFGVTQACAGWVDWSARTTWWVAVAAMALTLHIVAIQFDKRPAVSLAQIRAWAIRQTSFAVLFMLLWCSMSVFLWVPGAQLGHMVLALLLAASLSGAVSMSAVHPATAASTLVIHAFFMIVPFALSPTQLDHTLAWLGAAFVVLMVTQAVAMHGAIKKMLTLEHERSDLVEGLRLAKQESDRERSRAVAAGRAKSQFLSNMNHELRTPMNAILGFSELIKHKAFGAAIDKYAEYAEIIHQSGQNLLTLIDDMLDLAKIEGGKLSLREREINLAQLLTEIFDELEPKAAEAQLSLLKRVSPGLPRVIADERALRQIVSNLAANALKFTPAKGCVTLFAHCEDDGRIAFGVDDTGVGIADEDQSRVFERFGQGRHDVSSVVKGTGLGLAIVKGFAEAHDGEVKLESALGVGTRVTAYLPAERVCAAAVTPIRKAG